MRRRTARLDRSFVAELPASRHDHAIVAALVDLGRAPGLDVVAEGIEHAEQLAVLRELGCPRGQGFHFARPLPAEAVPGLAVTGPRGPRP